MLRHENFASYDWEIRKENERCRVKNHGILVETKLNVRIENISNLCN